MGDPTYRGSPLLYLLSLVCLYEEEEMMFASDIHQQITKEDIQNTKNEITKTSGEAFTEGGQSPFLSKIVPYKKSNEVLFGSSDVGDVSWVVPTAEFWGSSKQEKHWQVPH
jgi:aminobenzoyl-glutamate utilization protein B